MKRNLKIRFAVGYVVIVVVGSTLFGLAIYLNNLTKTQFKLHHVGVKWWFNYTAQIIYLGTDPIADVYIYLDDEVQQVIPLVTESWHTDIEFYDTRPSQLHIISVFWAEHEESFRLWTMANESRIKP